MPVGTALIYSSDEQLLVQARDGQAEALEELFGRYRQLAYRVAYRFLGNESDALDAVQDAFVKALMHLTHFQGRSSFKTWLLRVVCNAATDLGRQRGRRHALSLDSLGPMEREELEPFVLPETGSESDRQLIRQKIQEALAELSPAQRQTFILHAEAELSYREVAETLNISIGTVMSRLYYTRQRLRALLEPWMRTVQ